ncbi:hypothetical protein [Planosporangium mesophilum]|uniref:Uncharacterized protein n=1 Tax=Planosporangium mesophilum TaxID=689768 RepID=A0A8J3X649_9ACTN|nr:hypothetical protein [Planosporangium mesophilum]NJC83687.1 hypothetical protein [Planosporangium mesophilum]GII25353.1 hypothetical protein Pme01_49500 [Planosporangium mesophilum]
MQKLPVEHGHGLRGLDRHAWVTLAEREVFNLVNTSLAVPHLEIEARLWDAGTTVPGAPRRVSFFPHILSEAINNLVAGGNLELTSHTTKGGATAELYVPRDARRRTTAISAATRRKAMLYARFLRCSTTFGAAGEAVVRTSLMDAMPVGYLPMVDKPVFGEVPRIGTADRLPGALDSGAWLVIKDRDTGIPLPPHALLVEIKNRRMTLYPRHNEVHQLLHKAALVQEQHPDLAVVPLLICRRGHDRLFWMAKDLGFLVHATRAQYFTMPEDTTERHVDEMRNELGLADLKLVAPDTPARIISLFTSTIPKTAAATAARWSSVGSKLLPHYKELRLDTIDNETRNSTLATLRLDAEAELAAAGVKDPILAWALDPEGDAEGDWY